MTIAFITETINPRTLFFDNSSMVKKMVKLMTSKVYFPTLSANKWPTHERIVLNIWWDNGALLYFQLRTKNVLKIIQIRLQFGLKVHDLKPALLYGIT